MAERVFNRMKRTVYRKRIGLPELLSSLGVAALLAVVVGWVAAQQDNYDPGERDISIEVLKAQSVADRLYRRPVLAWAEPGSAPAAGEAGPQLGVFPQELLADNWQVGTRLKTFQPDNLYVKINGAAEQYLAYGFAELHSIGLQRGEGAEALDIELYDQGDFAGGLGIFSAQRDPARPVQHAGGLYYYETSAGAIGVKGRWFFKLAGNSSSPLIQDKARQLVTALTGLPVAEGDVPFGFTLLTQTLGVAFADVEFQPANAFQYDFAQRFWFGRVAPGATARWFLHQSADTNAAFELMDEILAEHRYDYETVSMGEDATVLQHKFLHSFFALAAEGPVLYGVENAASAEELDAQLSQLREALQSTDSAAQSLAQLHQGAAPTEFHSGRPAP